MKKRFILPVVIAALTACIITISAGAANIGGAKVNASSLNLRAGADTSAAIITQAPNGSPVVVMEQAANDWYKVWYNGYVGYMSAGYLDISNDISASIGYGTIKGTTVRLRAGASTDSAILTHLNTGNTVNIIGITGPWYQVSYNGVVGYIHSDYITLNLNAPAVGAESDIVSMGKKYLGVPYVWAGTSPSGFDCSGFVYYVFKECGFAINRTAASINSNGTFVQKSDLRPGDVICFTDGSYSYIGHVGIYIGDGQFIHASSGNGAVVISALSESYYTNHYYSARRIA